MAVKDMVEYQFTSEQDLEKAKENGRKGGIASGEARRKKATMKKTLEMLLDTKTKQGVPYRELATLGLIKGAISGKAENYRAIVQLLGELDENTAGTPEITINIVDNSELEKALYDEED